VSSQQYVKAILYSQERTGTHCTGGWVGPRAGLDRCGKSRPYRDSISGPSSPYSVAIPTDLPGPQLFKHVFHETDKQHKDLIPHKLICWLGRRKSYSGARKFIQQLWTLFSKQVIFLRNGSR
jgi:hypothetical protein